MEEIRSIRKEGRESISSILVLHEIKHMIDLGLGRGVDATNHSPWLNKSSFQVREVTPHNIIGTEEGGVLQSYSHEITSARSLQVNLSASVPLNKQVPIGVDAEHSRCFSNNRRSIGKKITTRTISYRADFDDLKQVKTPTSSVASLDTFHRRHISNNANHELSPTGSLVLPPLTFEQRLSKWILEHLYEEDVERVDELKPEDDPTEALANLLALYPDIEVKIGEKCKEFITNFNITHYVSSIELGASKYRIMSEEDYNMQVGVKGNIGMEQLASMAVEEKVGFIQRNKVTELTKIGNIENNQVLRGTCDEAVIGVKLQPISALVTMKLLKKKLQLAIMSYIKYHELSNATPFIISCNNETLFLKVTRRYEVVATPNIEESSHFYLGEEDDSGYKFSIMYMMPSPLGTGLKPIARYLSAPVNFLGRNEGPLQVRLNAKDTKTQLTLHSRRVQHFRPVETKEWMSSDDIFYINCKTRMVKKNAYLCVKPTPPECHVKGDYITCCVPTIKEQRLKDNFMLFRLIQQEKKKDAIQHVKRESQLASARKKKKAMQAENGPQDKTKEPQEVNENTKATAEAPQERTKGGYDFSETEMAILARRTRRLIRGMKEKEAMKEKESKKEEEKTVDKKTGGESWLGARG